MIKALRESEEFLADLFKSLFAGVRMPEIIIGFVVILVMICSPFGIFVLCPLFGWAMCFVAYLALFLLNRFFSGIHALFKIKSCLS